MPWATRSFHVETYSISPRRLILKTIKCFASNHSLINPTQKHLTANISDSKPQRQKFIIDQNSPFRVTCEYCGQFNSFIEGEGRGGERSIHSYWQDFNMNWKLFKASRI
jgi:hypothetical protein